MEYPQQYLSNEQADQLMKTWRATPHQPNGALVSIVYRARQDHRIVTSPAHTRVLIGGHMIEGVDYTAVEQGAAPRTYVFIVQAGSGFALRLPLGRISVEPFDATVPAETLVAPMPPEVVAWRAAYEAWCQSTSGQSTEAASSVTSEETLHGIP